MADTFTGLKLQGELGRFGRTEISDIEGYVELPDGKVYFLDYIFLCDCKFLLLYLWLSSSLVLANKTSSAPSFAFIPRNTLYHSSSQFKDVESILLLKN